MEHPWRYGDIPAAVTACDVQGTIVYMNPAAEALMAKRGGASLIGKNLFDCHSPASNEIIRRLLREGSVNAYMVRKPGACRMVYQAPWHEGQGANRRVGGLVEISFPVDDPPRAVERG
jgi:PAS domain-containing protein